MTSKKTITIVVVRHGESDANRRAIISDSNVDHALTARGVAQAEKTAGMLKDEKFQLVVSSTRQRARHTAEAVNRFHRADMITTDDLIERYYGMFSGMDKTKAYQIMETKGYSWLDIPNSETVAAVDLRVSQMLQRLVPEHAGKHILVSTHEDVVRAFYRLLGGVSVENSHDFEIANSEPHRFEMPSNT